MSHGIGMLLLTAVGGYWVLERASMHKTGDLKRVGKVLGWLIILVSVAGTVCNVWCLASWKMGSCSMPAKKSGWCPFSQQAPSTPAESQ